MAWTYEVVTPTPIENVLVERGLSDGVHKIYRVSAFDGYVLHDKRLDYQAADPITGEPMYDENGIEIMVEGFSAGTKTVAANYDFVANPNEFYAVLESDVPADSIFGGTGNNDHEVM